MKKVISLILLLLILIPIFVLAQNQDDEVRVLIRYKEQTESKFGLFSTQLSENRIIPEEKIKHKFENGKFSAIISKNEYDNLQLNPNVEIIKIPQRKISMINSVILTNSTNVWTKQIQNINITGKGETVCVIDTGVDYNHPDLGNCYGNNTDTSCKIIGGWDLCSDDTNCKTEDWDPIDVNGHGTHVIGIISANGEIKGIAPESKIVIVKVTNSTGTMWDDDIEAGIRFCINHADEFNISTISMSLGGGKSDTYCDGISDPFEITQAINDATAKNITVTIATGNEDYSDGISFPACIENATRIGSITKSNTMSSFSNAGNFFKDLLLTFGGTDGGVFPYSNPTNSNSNYIGSTYPNNQYAFMSGTSMSTPMAAGIITLLRQYKKLESNINLTTDYIKEVLINSSTLYEDAPSSGNYSIINSLAAILYSDTQGPNITSMLPENSSKLSQNQSFTCNATDLQLANLTIKIYNSTAYLVKNQTTSENSLTLYYQTTDGEYNWTCEAIDNNSNPTIKTNTLSVNDLFAQIQSLPEYTNQNETTFNCSAESTTELSNITFYIYNSSQPLNQINVSLTGTSNYSIFNYTLPTETNFTYFCIVENNESEQVKTINQTITYDTTKPIINLTFPANNSRTTSPVTFIYDETETNHDYCNITVNNEPSTTTRILDNGFYNWSVTCTDLANNTNISGIYKLEIYTAPIITSPSSGGGSSSRTPKTYTLKEEQMQQGITQKVKTKEIIKFKTKSQNHKLTLKSVDINKVNILLESNPLNITLYLNSPTLINLDNDKTFDLILTLTSINGKYANIFIKETNETVPMKHIMPIEINKTLDKQNETSIKENQTAETTTIKEDTIFSRTINYLVDRFLTKLKSFLELFGIQI